MDNEKFLTSDNLLTPIQEFLSMVSGWEKIATLRKPPPLGTDPKSIVEHCRFHYCVDYCKVRTVWNHIFDLPLREKEAPSKNESTNGPKSDGGIG